MATIAKPQTNRANSAPLGVTDYARAILTPLASLKLTVCLLVLGVAITFIASLEQTRADIYQVKMKHFSSHFVPISFETFFVPAWFPERQNVPGFFYIPSGRSILILMLLNLTAAHVLRFKLQAKGKRLAAGLGIAGLASFVTWAVIFNGQNAQGFQASPPISYAQMWILMQVGLLALAIGAGVSCFMIDKTRMAERVLLGSAALACTLTLGATVYLGSKAFIGDSAMRILWQLGQSTMAAAVGYVACVMLFRRKAGIVLLHLGIAGLMLNEIYVTATNDEHRMTIIEGETVSHAVDIRATEMAIIDVSDPEMDQITTVPGAKLSAGEPISDDKLPFDIKCLAYLPSSDLRQAAGSSNNFATAGVGLRFEAYELSTTAGTDSEQTVDFASAYVQLTSKQGKTLGTYLISQNIGESQSDAIQVGDKQYRIALRFETEYKPYSLTLEDAKVEYYIGTKTPRWYSSDVLLNDHENDVTSEQKIWMNNPLRYSDETFYQSGMNQLNDGRELTILQVVTNKGWMIPYVCCMFTVVGLMAQFGSSLISFLEKTRKKELSKATSGENAADPEATPQRSPKTSSPEKSKRESKLKSPYISQDQAPPSPVKKWLPAALMVGFFGIWSCGELAKSMRGTVVETESKMRLDLLGKIPIAMNGRVQPLDSFARNTARQLTKREFVFDKNEQKQPAIMWLADTMFEAKGYMDYRLFRIEDLNILNAIELPAKFNKPRGDFRYTLGELLKAEPKLRELISNADKKDPKTWSQFQRRLSSVAQMIQQVYGAKLAFGGPDRSGEDLLLRIEEASEKLSSPLIPLVIPTNNEETPWASCLDVKNRNWLVGLAAEYECDSTMSLAKAIIQKEILPSLREDMIRQRIIQRFLSVPEFRKAIETQYGETDLRVLSRALEQNWDSSVFPEDIKTELVAAEGPLVDAMISQQLPRYEQVMEGQLSNAYGDSGKILPEVSESSQLLLKLKPAYQSGDADTFNSTLETYLAKSEAAPPLGMQTGKINAELFYNAFSPFYVSMVIYLGAFFAALFGWMFWRESFNRAATMLLMLGLTIHIVGLITRIVISGRPPVTNLYSSVLFVSASMVVLMLIVERFTKLGIGNVMASLGAFLALLWAWTMTIVDGDTFTVMVAVLDTQFWLATHVVIISIGYAASFGAGMLGLAYLIAALLSPAMKTKDARRKMTHVMYGVVCFGLLCSFFGTVLGGLWGDDSWGRFWGWDPKENGALMIVLWNAVILHARWGGMVKERGMAALAVLGNVIVLWSWKGVNAMGVGLHAYAATEDDTVSKILLIGVAHVLVACLVVIPAQFWMSYRDEELAKLK